MDAFSPGASLSMRGSMVGACFRLEDWVWLDPFFLLFLKCRAIRVPALVVGGAGGGATFRSASSIVGCRDALLSARGEGLSGRVTHAERKMFLHLGAMEGSMPSGPVSFSFLMRQSSHPVDERSARKYLRLCVSFWVMGNRSVGFAHINFLSSRI